ncbi:amidase [Rhodopila globiformis]|uniref:amidase n=1 Tax=Rhodopila globiformis TaxID=1071 RepID=UPI001958A5DB|nr:amidase family protein [Rhodopila globiformis]
MTLSWKTDAATLADAVRRRDVSAVELAQAALARIDKLDATLHAFCTPTPELALREATAVDRAIAAGEPVGPLAGVPYGIKDLICTRDVRTMSGAVAYADFVPDEDDVVVERMRAAGAVALGKTNVPEFGYSGVGHNPVCETTVNPWDTTRTPGGSSAGSGAAVAAGLCPIALGSDGGGSVRIPSSFCGLVGVKASMGRVPLYPGTKDERYPGVSSWESLEHIGPMTRTVRDAALMLSVIAGPDARDRLSIPTCDIDWLAAATPKEMKGLRVAYSPDWGYAAVDPEVRRIVGEAVRVFEQDLGCSVEEAHPGFSDPLGAFWALVAMETDLKGMRAIVAEHGDRMTPHLVEFIRRDWKAEDLTDALMVRKAVTNKLWRFMRNYDLLLTPTLAVPAFGLHVQGVEKIDGRMVTPSSWLAFTFPMNMTGQPAASVPAGFTASGLPVGLQIIGRHLDDASVLRAAASFEAARPWADRWPAMAQ